MRLLVFVLLMLPAVACVVASGKYHEKAIAHKKPEVAWWRVRAPGQADPDLYDDEGKAYQALANRWNDRGMLAFLVGVAVAAFLQG
jgi:hypothetical protein